MRNVVYVAPFPGITATARFGRALRSLRDIRLLGLFQEAPRGDHGYDDYVVVRDALDPRQLIEGAEILRKRYGDFHRVVGILENVQVQLAMVAKHYGLPGGDVEAAERFRDKGTMKDALRAIGVPVAAHARLHSEQDGLEAAERIGLPLVLKPTSGAGCRSTYEVRSPHDLRVALAESRPSRHHEVIAEEFLEGNEYSFDTVCLHGKPVFHSISRYFPGPLEVTRNPWIQWVVILPRDISGPWFDDIRRVAFDAVRKMGMGSGVTHMEWFRKKDGRIAIGEVAMRPPGAQFCSLVGYAHDIDFYRTWARAAVDDAFDGPHDRRYAVGICYLRGAGQGRVVRVDGLEEAQRRVQGLVVEAKLPTIGAPKSSSYEGDGYVIVRHPSDDVVQAATKIIVETVQVRYG
ncbi:MAG: ATP-grasp domain-containing protein [Alphaproteobacteria bacterium]|nr:ATP-grasp domain-containing protein [Alphaproteobacteria bacterium]MCB9699721.1 ATP-grasp domain-containing protein [Alphaproteobacteria bacterium]